MSQVKNGNFALETDFEKFFKENEKMAFNFAYSIVSNPEDAKDAVQEAFMKFYKAKDRIDKDKNVKAYLFQIIKNVCFDMLKEKRYTEQLDNISIRDEKNKAEEIDRKTIIKKALEILNRQERMVVVLLTFKGFSSKEAGEILGISDSTVRNHFMSGRNKIKNFIIKNFPEYARSI